MEGRMRQMTVVADRAAGVWTVVETDPKVFSLFGTYILPTPFFLSMPAADVVARIKALNPGRTVVLAETR